MERGEPPTPSDSPLRLHDVMADAAYLALRTPDVHVGELAPDFALPLLGASQTVRLSSHRGTQPVALVFGSFT